MKLIDHFRNLTSNDFLKNQRQLAADSLKKMGLPTLKWEDWKYTPLNALIETEFERAQSLTSHVSFTSSHVFNESAHSIVFINGHFSKEHSHISTLPEGLQITSLKEALLNPSTIFKKTLGQISTFNKAPFAALNLSAFEDGCLVQVSKNVKIGSPIQILYLSEQKTPFMSFPRNLIVMEEGSEAQIIEAYEGSNIYFNNAVTEVQLAENAKLEYTKLQQESLNAFHIHQCTVHQTANSQFISTVIDLGARLARNDLNAL
ncbi:MAG: SufD family Fe-S cluster assembly protein, partial [Deltaproteobacteria bacterium]|nr:SufD family Fe-S cluster assembly protein [Deltaproteobacteria bacterium]